MKLTENEIKALELICQGCSDLDIAEEIGYSSDYVKKMLQKLRKTFKAKNRTELAVLYNNLKNASWI